MAQGVLAARLLRTRSVPQVSQQSTSARRWSAKGSRTSLSGLGRRLPVVMSSALFDAHIRQVPGRSLIKGLRPPVRSRYASRPCSHARGCLAVPPGRTSSERSAMRARFRATAALSFNEPLHRPAVGIPADTASSVHNGQPLDISQCLVAHITLKVNLPSRSSGLQQPEESLLRRTEKRPRTPGPLLVHAPSGLGCSPMAHRSIDRCAICEKCHGKCGSISRVRPRSRSVTPGSSSA